MDINFNGKRALVTGATKGIGYDIATQLAKCGAQVIAVGRTKHLLDELTRKFPSIETVALDITDWEETEKVLGKIGHIDLLVNNAGMGWLKSMMEITEKDVDE
ncbi:hypothetical protein NQ317_013462 [Molorchus minor]|uniref:Uncharacterized protein n=1 Tax=Molorchus minor TaxID=1323400 RepID=A0ABQ9J657_9CUCU|nr:hypothetical protein NQ317_013462 [Molorchus minor]